MAKSMICNECGKKFRSVAQAEFHASKTYVTPEWRGRRGISLSRSGLTVMRNREHVDFSESTEEIAPLTEEEKKARLEELRQNLAEKRAKQAILDKEEQKRNEVCAFPVFTHIWSVMTPQSRLRSPAEQDDQTIPS